MKRRTRGQRRGFFLVECWTCLQSCVFSGYHEPREPELTHRGKVGDLVWRGRPGMVAPPRMLPKSTVVLEGLRLWLRQLQVTHDGAAQGLVPAWSTAYDASQGCRLQIAVPERDIQSFRGTNSSARSELVYRLRSRLRRRTAEQTDYPTEATLECTNSNYPELECVSCWSKGLAAAVEVKLECLADADWPKDHHCHSRNPTCFFLLPLSTSSHQHIFTPQALFDGGRRG